MNLASRERGQGGMEHQLRIKLEQEGLSSSAVPPFRTFARSKRGTTRTREGIICTRSRGIDSGRATHLNNESEGSTQYKKAVETI